MKTLIATIFLGVAFLSVSALAQDIYVYPNKKLADEGLIEYRAYTPAEARAFEEGGSFAPYSTLSWGPERRLTEQENVYRARVVTSGDSLFCGYSTITNDEAFFIRSLDGGISWEPYTILDDSTRVLFHYFPEILRYGNDLIIGQMIRWVGQGYNLSYYRSTDYGESWSSVNEVFSYYDNDLNHFSSFGNFEQLIYASYRNFDEDSIYVVRSTDWGDTWNDQGINVAYLSSLPQPMTVRASGSNAHLVWVNENQPISCRYSRSTDQGITWSEEIDIANDSLGAQLPYMAIQDSHVVVCWMGYKYSPYSFTGDLFLRQSFDFGETWGEAQVLTDLHKVGTGAVYCEDSLLSAVWMDRRFGGGNDEVFTRTSFDYGTTWTDEERLSYGEDHSYEPISCKTGDKIHVLWGDIRPDSPGLYYRANDLVTTVYNEEVISPPINIYLNFYPNPFNSETIITYQEIEGGDIDIYNVNGQLVKTLECTGKKGQITWDASDDSGYQVSSGVYFIRARTADGYASKKVLFLR